MKAIFSLRAGAVSAMLALAGCPGTGAADTLRGALLKGETASDIYDVTCPRSGSTRLDVGIESLKKVPYILTASTLFGDKSVSTSDKKGADRKPSSLSTLAAGRGTYTVTVSKTLKPRKKEKTLKRGVIYTLTYHCIMGTEHTETEVQVMQNQ